MPRLPGGTVRAVSEQPANPVTEEDGGYATIGSMVRGLRRTGSTFMEACATAGIYWAVVHMSNVQPGQDGT